MNLLKNKLVQNLLKEYNFQIDLSKQKLLSKFKNSEEYKNLYNELYEKEKLENDELLKLKDKFETFYESFKTFINDNKVLEEVYEKSFDLSWCEKYKDFDNNSISFPFRNDTYTADSIINIINDSLRSEKDINNVVTESVLNEFKFDSILWLSKQMLVSKLKNVISLLNVESYDAIKNAIELRVDIESELESNFNFVKDFIKEFGDTILYNNTYSEDCW